MRIDTVLFDMGGTLEDIKYNKEIRLDGVKHILNCLKNKNINIDASPEVFLEILEKRNSEYKAWCEKSTIESSALEIWHKWHLKDFHISEEELLSICEELAFIWETRFYKRSLREEVPSVLEELRSKGYKLGIISNTSSCTQVFKTLKDYGIENYFDCVYLSSIEGVRKPNVDIFYKAVKALNSSPESSAYVGDTVSRDVIGSKNAGFAAAIQIASFLTKASDSKVEEQDFRPDYVISNMKEVLGILNRINCDS
jgi:putative hydrolase of the HAD superfamily